MEEIKKILKRGIVIPAHPLALNEDGSFDERGQRLLSRYYLASGAGGLAIGVHTTQFEIHDEKIGLFEPVLKVGIEEIERFEKKSGKRIIKVAGICGDTEKACKEATIAKNLGYDLGLLNLSSLKGKNFEEIIAHCRKVSEIIYIFGFYLNPKIGGIELPFEFWCKFFEIENVYAVKIAPFDRYRTVDVMRAIEETERYDISLYTGNDDTIIFDLISIYKGKKEDIKFSGGLLGHWAFWTKKAVEYFERIRNIMDNKSPLPDDILKLAIDIIDLNSAVFDTKNNFSGCIPGINYILFKSGLMKNIRCVNPSLKLSPGQKEEIDRVYQKYSYLNDQDFVKENIDKWTEEL